MSPPFAERSFEIRHIGFDQECNELLNARNSLPQETGTGQYAFQNPLFQNYKIARTRVR